MSENLNEKIWAPTVSEIPCPVPKGGIPEGYWGPVIPGLSAPGTNVLVVLSKRADGYFMLSK